MSDIESGIAGDETTLIFPQGEIHENEDISPFLMSPPIPIYWSRYSSVKNFKKMLDSHQVSGSPKEVYRKERNTLATAASIVAGTGAVTTYLPAAFQLTSTVVSHLSAEVASPPPSPADGSKSLFHRIWASFNLFAMAFGFGVGIVQSMNSGMGFLSSRFRNKVNGRLRGVGVISSLVFAISVFMMIYYYITISDSVLGWSATVAFGLVGAGIVSYIVAAVCSMISEGIEKDE